MFEYKLIKYYYFIQHATDFVIYFNFYLCIFLFIIQKQCCMYNMILRLVIVKSNLRIN